MRYAIIGVAGYVARKHLDAIQATGGEVVVACDYHDAVGILDSYSPECRFHLDRDAFYDDLVTKGVRARSRRGRWRGSVDVLVVLTPNHRHIHDAIPALEAGLQAVIEKPLGLTADATARALHRYSAAVHPVVQLRDHPAVIEHMARPQSARGSRVEIWYTVHRGPWYAKSWKGKQALSGGILSNIGIHLFDLCIYMFGAVATWRLDQLSATSAVGRLSMECGTEVRWQLSTNAAVDRRVISIDNGRWRLDLSDVARLHLHRTVYQRQIEGRSWRVDDVLRAVRLVEAMRIG